MHGSLLKTRNQTTQCAPQPAVCCCLMDASSTSGLANAEAPHITVRKESAQEKIVVELLLLQLTVGKK
jgi:hypothetical protein